MPKLLTDSTTATPAAQGQPFLDRNAPPPIDKAKRDAALREWGMLDAAGKTAAGPKDAFLLSRGVSEPPPAAMHTHRLRDEAAARFNAGFDRTLLPLPNISSDRSAIELLASLESVDALGELYLFQKKCVGRTGTRNSGLSADDRISVRNCLRQGRELYVAGLGGGLMAKPLSHFYSLTAYAYAVAVMCNPNHHSLDTLPGSHGVSHKKDDFSLEFGGDTARGTFSELHGSLTTNYVPLGKAGFVLDQLESIHLFHERRVSTGLKHLLSMVPEIRQFFVMATGSESSSHPVSVTTEIGEIEMAIGDGERVPSAPALASAFPNMQLHSRGGKTVLRLRAADLSRVRTALHVDLMGRIWFVDAELDGVLLPELCLHFLILSSLSSIMRYAPRLWGEILLNEVDSSEALLLRQYFIALESKLPVLMIRTLSKFFPVLSAG